MDSNKVLAFLELLSKETEGHSEDLSVLYKKALDSDDSVVRLRAILSDYSFADGEDNLLFIRGKEALAKLYDAPTKALENLTEVEQTAVFIEEECNYYRSILRSPDRFVERIAVIKSKDIIGYLSAYRMIANTCVYLSVLYGGMSVLNNAFWEDGYGLPEMTNAVNMRFLPLLSTIRKPMYWIIEKHHLSDDSLFQREVFDLQFVDIQVIEKRCSSLRKEQMGTHSFLNVDAYENSLFDVPYCWGIGNILSVLPNNAVQLLRENVITNLRCPTLTEISGILPTPIECVKKLSDEKHFCISPMELSVMLNRWVVGNKLHLMKINRKCLLCGKPLSENRTVCSSHF